MEFPPEGRRLDMAAISPERATEILPLCGSFSYRFLTPAANLQAPFPV
jgi:hypothetical protein